MEERDGKRVEGKGKNGEKKGRWEERKKRRREMNGESYRQEASEGHYKPNLNT